MAGWLVDIVTDRMDSNDDHTVKSDKEDHKVVESLE
jgi:hypothetical protein